MGLKEQEMIAITDPQSLIPTCVFVCKWQYVYSVKEDELEV